MLGVVLWSDQTDRKAVFWCEDHGDLAYYEAQDASLDTAAFFDAGDMVQFDVKVDQRLRKASNAVVVQERACSGLPETLKRTAPKMCERTHNPQNMTSAKIIAFSLKEPSIPAPLLALKA